MERKERPGIEDVACGLHVRTLSRYPSASLGILWYPSVSLAILRHLRCLSVSFGIPRDPSVSFGILRFPSVFSVSFGTLRYLIPRRCARSVGNHPSCGGEAFEKSLKHYPKICPKMVKKRTKNGQKIDQKGSKKGSRGGSWVHPRIGWLPPASWTAPGRLLAPLGHPFGRLLAPLGRLRRRLFFFSAPLGPHLGPSWPRPDPLGTPPEPLWASGRVDFTTPRPSE